MLSSAKKEKIQRFADRITPKNWNVVLRPEDEIKEPGVLNVLIRIQKPETEIFTDYFGNKCYPYESKDGIKYFVNRYGDVFLRNQVKPALGMVSGRMVFKDLKSTQTERKGKFAKITIKLWPYLGDWKGTLIHELAHVAVYRYTAFKTKEYRKKNLFKNTWNMNPKTLFLKKTLQIEGHHGPAFQRSFSMLAKRAIREFGAEIPSDDIFWMTIRYELKKYQGRRKY
ncbi:MAG: hypothetical protein PVJ06_08280 [Desulfobacterales bacterium]|jgi:hypothetical protein